jgi:hypothetical protein
LRRRDLDARESMPVGRDRAQHGRAPALDGVEVDTVEVIPRLLGRDRELGLVDEAAQIRWRQRELERHLARGEVGEIALGQRLQHEAGAAGTDLHLAGIAGGLERDLRAFGELTDDVVDDVRRYGRGAALGGVGIDRLRNLDVEVGRLEAQTRAVAAQQHVREDRDGVAALDDAMHMAERPQQRRSFDRDLHGPDS